MDGDEHVVEYASSRNCDSNKCRHPITKSKGHDYRSRTYQYGVLHRVWCENISLEHPISTILKHLYILDWPASGLIVFDFDNLVVLRTDLLCRRAGSFKQMYSEHLQREDTEIRWSHLRQSDSDVVPLLFCSCIRRA